MGKGKECLAEESAGAVIEKYSNMVYRLAYAGQAAGMMRMTYTRRYSCGISGGSRSLTARSIARPGCFG